MSKLTNRQKKIAKLTKPYDKITKSDFVKLRKNKKNAYS